MKLLTDVIRDLVIEQIDLIGTQHGAEAWLGLPRSTLSRFVRGQGVTGESLDRLVEALGVEAVTEALLAESKARWSHKGNPYPDHPVDPKYMVNGSPSYWTCATCLGPVLLGGKNPPVTASHFKKAGERKEPDMGAQP